MKYIKKKIIFIPVIILALLIGIYLLFFRSSGDSSKASYQTQAALIGTFVDSVSASGEINASNFIGVTTQVTGIVKQIFVTEGDKVKVGDKILEIEPDQVSIQARTKAFAALISAKSSLDSALQSRLSAQKDITDAQLDLNNTIQSKTSLQKDLNNAQAALTQAQIDWDAVSSRGDDDKTKQQKSSSLKAATDSLTLAQQKYNSLGLSIDKNNKAINLAQQKYTNLASSIDKANADISAAQYSYDILSPVVTAPIDGEVSAVVYTVGS